MDIVAEALAFFNEVRGENDLDLASPLTWGYILGPLGEGQVEAVKEALGRQGFAGVAAVRQEGSESLHEVHFSEVRIHTPDSFAERIQGLADLARTHGCELLDWSIEADPGGDDEPESEADGAEEPDGKPGPEADVADGRRIVEVCSAANAMEAYALRAVLEDAEIRAEVVGDILGTAGGGLPLGEATAPRIWVQAKDARRARQIIAQSGTWHPAEPAEWPEESGPPAEEESAEEQEASGAWGAFLSGGFFIAALALLLFGAAQAWRNWTVLRTYPAKADADFVGTEEKGHPRRVFIPEAPRVVYFRIVRDAQYAYVVDGREYLAVVKGYGDDPPPHVPIYYDPHCPADHVVGPLTSPGWILAFTAGAAAFLCFVGRQFR